MRFNIRNLLWFTLLAAIGCWWWMPSSNDAKVMQRGYLWDGFQMKRFTSRESLVKTDQILNQNVAKDFDFAQRDALIVQYAEWRLPGVPNSDDSTPRISTRGSGRLVLFVEREPLGLPSDELVSVAKNAHVFEVAAWQLYLIDGGVAAGLLTLAIGSLFVGRKRGADQPASAEPVSI